MIAVFFAGAMIGVGATLLFAMWLAARPKSDKAPDNVNSFSATSVTMGGNQTPPEVQIDKQMLTKILKAYGADKYFELPDQNTRH
jgi:hypothetical protein